jgi:hypothetical protein
MNASRGATADGPPRACCRGDGVKWLGACEHAEKRAINPGPSPSPSALSFGFRQICRIDLLFKVSKS